MSARGIGPSKDAYPTVLGLDVYRDANTNKIYAFGGGWSKLLTSSNELKAGTAINISTSKIISVIHDTSLTVDDSSRLKLNYTTVEVDE